MEWMGLNDIREKFLSFFESKNHLRMASASLVPKGDSSLLLVNSGMAPLKKYFQGVETPPNVRVTTCQKCVRMLDIERVGKTSRHGSYFEMLGNFSFGEYFKEEATTWAWEFCTEVMKLPKERLFVSVYHEDDESYDIWVNKRNVPESHMVRLGKADNFWEIGTGPCGPCTEIYFDRGADKGCGSPDCKVGCDCDRYVEFWNLVFSQFDSDGQGNYARMAHPNIDTGMGLERLACIMQGVDNLFEVDTVQNIMSHVCRLVGVTYRADEKSDVSLRVITDHIRSTVFLVGDGVMPSNEGRGYVLRRLLRRAARHGLLLGMKEPFLNEVVETVILENERAYPELREKADYIKKIILSEEESFSKTVEKGMEMLLKAIQETKAKGSSTLSGEEVFKLSDTFGFPLDLTMEIAEEKGLEVDQAGYQTLMQEQRAKARNDRASKGNSSWDNGSLEGLPAAETVFVGYESLQADTVVTGIYKEGKAVDTLEEGEEGLLLLETTSFYAESGGQVGDQGRITIGESTFIVSDTKKAPGGHVLHVGYQDAGSTSKGDKVKALVDREVRQATMRNHSCAHLLQAALREVLGGHVHQAGQLVDSKRLRFDFSHFAAMTAEEIAKVEAIVNQKIMDSQSVTVKEMAIDEARALGAVALFGEKYGNVVRVVDMSGWSIEFCGGTHVDNTAKLGLFKILSESSVAAGVRRIEAVTGMGVLTVLDEDRQLLNETASVVKATGVQELLARCKAMSAEIKALEKEISSLNAKMASGALEGVLGEADEVNGLKCVIKEVEVEGEALRAMGDTIKEQAPDCVALLISKKNMLCVCGKEAVAKGANAGKLVKELAPILGGKGGGRPDSAMAGVADLSKMGEVKTAFLAALK